MTNDTQLKHRDFWKDLFTILNCFNIIDNAWTQLTYKTLNTSWKKPRPDSAAERDVKWFEPYDSALIDEIESMVKRMGLEVGSEDVRELLKRHEI